MKRYSVKKIASRKIITDGKGWICMSFDEWAIWDNETQAFVPGAGKYVFLFAVQACVAMNNACEWAARRTKGLNSV